MKLEGRLSFVGTITCIHGSAYVMQVDERASRRFVAQMEEVREQCAQEKEQACAHERELARQRCVDYKQSMITKKKLE